MHKLLGRNKLFTLMAIIVISLVFLLIKQISTIKPKPIDNKLNVSASFYPLYFFAYQIAGDKADVYNITPAGSEPHDYDPTALDIARIEKGNMLILSGGVESWGDKMKSNLKSTNTKIVIASEGLLTKSLAEEGESIRDPHVWLNPILAKKEVEKITDGFIEIDPKNSDYYKNNEQNLNGKLDNLDQKYKRGLSDCQTRDIITSHTAFAYLADQYDLNQVSIAGLSPDAEPSAKQLANVADFAKKNNIRYIFFE